jgi:hypothetical protein
MMFHLKTNKNEQVPFYSRVFETTEKRCPGQNPLYVRATIDGDNDEFSLSRKVLAEEWNQEKQKCTTKSRVFVAVIAGCRFKVILFDF